MQWARQATALYRQLLTHYLRPVRGRVGVLGVFLVAAISLQLVAPLILRAFIDAAGRGDTVSHLVAIAAFFTATALASQIIVVAEAFTAEDVAWAATNRLREDLAAHLLSLDMGYHYQHHSGELIQRLDYDVGILANFFSRFVLRILAGALLLVGVLVVLATLDGWIGLIFAMYVAVVLVGVSFLRRQVTPAARADLATMGNLFSFIQERLAGREDVRSRGAIQYVLGGLYRHMGMRLRARRKAASLYALLVGSMDLVAVGGTALAFVLGSYLYHAGMITIGTVYSMIYYLAIVAAPQNELTQQTQDYQQAAAGIGRIQEVLETSPAVADVDYGCLPDGPLSVSVDRVSFSYGSGDRVLHNVSIDVPAGTVLGVVGRTGSGKSTLSRLMVRLHDPTEGTVHVGDIDLRSVPQREVRRRVAMVTQEVQLFHATVRDNITLFDRSVSDRHIVEAMRVLGLTDWLASLPAGLDTQLAADTGLSAGEAQLLALTRVFLHDPGLVILDEPSSRLDPVTEQRIERALDVLLARRTAVIVAHRLSTVGRADAVLVLDNGRVVEQGSQEELAQNPQSLYARWLRADLEAAG